MKLLSLSEKIIGEYLDTSQSSWHVLTLTDGRSLPIITPSPYTIRRDNVRIEIPVSGIALEHPKQLMSAIHQEKSVCIPLNRIALQ